MNSGLANVGPENINGPAMHRYAGRQSWPKIARQLKPNTKNRHKKNTASREGSNSPMQRIESLSLTSTLSRAPFAARRQQKNSYNTLILLMYLTGPDP